MTNTRPAPGGPAEHDTRSYGGGRANGLGHLLAVEMRRALHRRIVRWMVALAIGLSALAGLAVYLTSRDPIELQGSQDHPAQMASWAVGSGDSYLLTAAVFLVVGAAICGASVAGAEWRAGTMTTVLTWEPSRLRLHGARTASAAILAALISFGLQIVYLVAAMPAVALNGSTDGTDSQWWLSLMMAMVRISMISALIAVLAVSIATIGRNTSAALIAIAAWALVVERLIAGLRPQWARFMISENVATVVPWSPMTGVDFERPPLVALITLVAYLGAIVAVASVSFARRDVVSV